MTSYFGLDPDSLEKSVYLIFQKAAAKQRMDIHEVIQKTRFENLSILPASTAIATLDKQLGTKEGMGLVLAKQLLSLKGQYDYIFVDCPPMLGVLMINALAACDQLLIPVQTEHLALKGLDRMLSTIKMINRARRSPINYAIIPTMFDRRTRAAIECLRLMQKKYDPKALKRTIIPVDTKFREASRDGVPLPLYSPQTRGSVAYNLLLDALLDEFSHE
jgi:chromosome partitioning protein